MYQKRDHFELDEAEASRRYFQKFDGILRHLFNLIESEAEQKKIRQHEVEIFRKYLGNIVNTFTALSYKYLMTEQLSDAYGRNLEMDRVNSGFPVYSEILKMANDAMQVSNYLSSLPKRTAIMEDMIREILSENKEPVNLQYAMAQRTYYEILAEEKMFWAQNHPCLTWAMSRDYQRNSFVVDWAIYDSQTNLPVIYTMEIEVSGSEPFMKDQEDWPRLQSYLLAQSMSSLKLLTIGQGIDKDFENVHPMSLRRFTLGPMHSRHFTKQNVVIDSILEDTKAPVGEDWIFGWTIETLLTKNSKVERTGIFRRQEIQLFDIDSMDTEMVELGATSIERSIVTPLSVYQTIRERNPVSLRDFRKYAVNPNGGLLSYS